MIPRWLHKLYAKMFGYFWLPCPVCGKPFGGHEHVWTEVLEGDGDAPSNGRIVCSYQCGAIARVLNRLRTIPNVTRTKERLDKTRRMCYYRWNGAGFSNNK